MWMVVGQLGLLFCYTQRQLLSLLHPARSRGRNGQDTNLVHSYKRMEYGARGEKKKWKSRKQTKGRMIKIS